MDTIRFAQPKTQLEEDLHSIEAPLLSLDTYLRLAATAMNEALDRFWALPDDRIEAILNHYGPQQVEAIFAAHAEKATMLNMLMEARGLNPAARVGASRELEVDSETGVITLKPLPEPEPLPEPVDKPTETQP